MDTARDGADRLVKHANGQSCCLQLDSCRPLVHKIRDFVILQFIARRKIGNEREQEATSKAEHFNQKNAGALLVELT